MKEIKFRVYANTDDGLKMVYLKPLECDNGLWFQCADHIDDYENAIMQFTGLKDSKGVEIYEGDIVKFHYFFQGGGLEGVHESEHSLIGIIEWGNFGWGIRAIEGEHWQGYTGYEKGQGACNFLDLMAMNESSIHEESFQVVGDIYETKKQIPTL